jgi:hypothetical protein
MSCARKSVNDIANEPTIGTIMNTANTITNGRANPTRSILDAGDGTTRAGDHGRDR